MGRFAGRRVLVTGAAGGQGRAVAARLAAEGAALGLTDRDESGLDAVVAALPPETRVATAVADVRCEQQLETAVGTVVDELGGLDAAYANAGVYAHERDAPVDRLALDDWRFVLDVNLTGTYLLAKHAIPHLLNGEAPVLVTVASTAASAGDVACHAYAAAKGGLLALTRSIAQRWGPDGLRAVVLSPGFIATPMVDFALADEEVADAIRATTALRRFGSPEEVAAVAAFLLSAEASFVTACVLDVHGGLIK